jgi:hypothetical protein
MERVFSTQNSSKQTRRLLQLPVGLRDQIAVMVAIAGES